MKKLLLIVALASLSGCSIMHKAISHTHEHIIKDSTSVLTQTTDVSVRTAGTDTNKTIISHTVIKDIDTSIRTGPIIISGSGKISDSGVILEDGDYIKWDVDPVAGTIKVTAATIGKTIPIKVHDTERSRDTTITVGKHDEMIEGLETSKNALDVHSNIKSDIDSKTKTKAVYNFPVYVYIIAGLLLVCFIAWKYGKTIVRWFA